MFPEGTRNIKANYTGQLLPFKKGAFKMAINCQVPVIPVVYSPYYFIDREKKQFGQGLYFHTKPTMKRKRFKLQDNYTSKLPDKESFV